MIKLTGYVSWIIKLLCSVLLRVPFRLDGKKIVVQVNGGMGYTCNPKYIVQKIIDLRLDFDIYWVVQSVGAHNNLPETVRQIKKLSPAAYYHYSTAKFWIDNTRKPFYFHKKNEQVYIQTWHSSTRLKKVEGDALASLKKQYVWSSKKDSEMADVILSGSKFNSETVRRAFWYDGPIMEYGSPRNDIMFIKDNSGCKRRIADAYGFGADKKIAMYAPTFRDKGKTLGPSDLDYPELAAAIKKRFGGEWALLIRRHPVYINMHHDLFIDNGAAQAAVTDVTDYNDMQELLSVTDLLITDYSSTMFDIALCETPCLLYTPDIETYDRGTYFSLDELPFPYATDKNGLLSVIAGFDAETYRSRVREFNSDIIGTFEKGIASEKAVEYIQSKAEGGFARRYENSNRK